MRTLVKAIIRILALFFFLRLLGPAISSISNIAIVFKENAPRELAIMSIGGTILIILMAVVVLLLGWRKTDEIVRILVGDTNDSELVISTSNTDLYRILTSFFGIYLVANSVPSLAGFFTNYFFLKTQFPGYPGDKGMLASQISYLVTHTVTLLLGIWFVAGRRTIVKMLGNIYNYGSIRHNPEKEE